MKKQVSYKLKVDPTRFELDHEDTMSAICVLIGKLGVDWLSAYLVYSPKWWRWN